MYDTYHRYLWGDLVSKSSIVQALFIICCFVINISGVQLCLLHFTGVDVKRAFSESPTNLSSSLYWVHLGLKVGFFSFLIGRYLIHKMWSELLF